MRILAAALLSAFLLGGQAIPIGSSGAPVGGAPACSTPVFSMTTNASTTPWTGSSTGDCTLTGTTRVEDPTSSGEYTLLLDGDNDDARCGTDQDNLLAGDMTVMAWIRIPAYTANAQVVIAKSAIGALNWSWRLQVTPDTPGRIALTLENTSDLQEQWGTDADSFDAFIGLSTFTHIAFKASGCNDMDCASVQAYINGSPVTTSLITDNGGTLRDDATYTMLHGIVNDSLDLTGRIAGTEIYAALESDACVASRFAAGKPGP